MAMNDIKLKYVNRHSGIVSLLTFYQGSTPKLAMEVALWTK